MSKIIVKSLDLLTLHLRIHVFLSPPQLLLSKPHPGNEECRDGAVVVMHDEGAGSDGGTEIVTSSIEADALAKMNAGGSKENGDNDRQPPFVRCIVLFRTGMLFLRGEFFRLFSI